MARRSPDAVDVVVPQAASHGEVAALVAGLRGARAAYRLVLVDEATTEFRQGALRKRLVAQAGAPCVWLRANGAGAMSALAAALAEGRGDVVLVDPRLRLTAGWLDRLLARMASDPRIGVVGTWSTATSDATGLMPRLAIGGGWHAPDCVDEAVALAALPVAPDAGVVAGPCILVRRAVLEAARAAGRLGSLAALSAAAHGIGLRAVLATDVVAQQVPYVFDPGAPDADDTGVGAALAALGPDDPLAPLRTLLGSTLAMLERADAPGVLHVAHPRGGGTERYLQSVIAATSKTHRHYVLRIHADRWTLEDARDETFATYDWPRAGSAVDDGFLRDVCAWLHVDLVHVHSLVGSGDDFLRALAAAAVPYLYTVHDMYVPCPTIYLIDRHGRYCNATTDLATCRDCLAGMPALCAIDIADWRERYARFIAGAARVVAPSAWAAATIRAYYPQAAIDVVPHGTAAATAHSPDADALPAAASDAAGVDPDAAPPPLDLPVDAHRHVAVLGAVGPEKGSRRIDAMVERIRERGLPLRLVVIGYTDREVRYQSNDRVLNVHGPYDRGDVERLCTVYRIDVLAFPSIWPETFSYTLGEGWAAGRPAVVPARGALGERVTATGAGWTIDPEADVDAWLDLLVAVTAPDGAAELREKARCAGAAAAAWATTSEPVVALYAQFARGDAAAERRVPVPRAVYLAACRAAGVVALPEADPSVPAQRDAAATRTPARSVGRWVDRLRRIVR